MELEFELNWLKDWQKELEDSREEEANEQVKLLIWKKCSQIQNRIEQIMWLLKSRDEKQAKRIYQIGLKRRYVENLDKELQIIDFYENIRSTIPYIIALNDREQLPELLELCEKELNIIDANNSYLINHVSKEEIEKAFFPFFNEIKLPKEYEHLTNHPEAEKRVEDLYDNFLRILNLVSNSIQ